MSLSLVEPQAGSRPESERRRVRKREMRLRLLFAWRVIILVMNGVVATALIYAAIAFALYSSASELPWKAVACIAGAVYILISSPVSLCLWYMRNRRAINEIMANHQRRV